MENRSTDADVRGTAGFLCPTGAARALKDGLVGEPLAGAGPGSAGKIRRVSGAFGRTILHQSNGWLALRSGGTVRRLDEIEAEAEAEAQQLNICSESWQIARIHVSGRADQRRGVGQ